jgi:DNA-binding MarR family transcriptional regulator/N-acetylglutamate synthase-like GNAT family acetyltransferase
MSPDEQIAAVRRFNRVVTKRAGALEASFLGRDRPLGESRVLWEVGARGVELRELRDRLDLDSGYLSRLVHALDAKGLVALEPGADDERVRYARLTPLGLSEVAETDRRADRVAAGILEPLTARQRERLVAAMDEVHRLLRFSGVRIERVHPSSPAARLCVARYFAELDERFPQGFDPAASLPADEKALVPPLGAFLVARTEGEAIGGGALKGLDRGVVSIKRMWVDGSVRGLGLGRRLLGALEAEARALGYTLVRLETNGTLAEAIRLYRTSGYREVAAFNDDPYAEHWFEKALGGEPPASG